MVLSNVCEFLKNKYSLESLNMMFRNTRRSAKGIFGQNMSDSPNGSLSDPIDRFHCHAIKNKLKTIQWIKSRNCDLIGNT